MLRYFKQNPIMLLLLGAAVTYLFIAFVMPKLSSGKPKTDGTKSPGDATTAPPASPESVPANKLSGAVRFVGGNR